MNVLEGDAATAQHKVLQGFANQNVKHLPLGPMLKIADYPDKAVAWASLKHILQQASSWELKREFKQKGHYKTFLKALTAPEFAEHVVPDLRVLMAFDYKRYSYERLFQLHREGSSPHLTAEIVLGIDAQRSLQSGQRPGVAHHDWFRNRFIKPPGGKLKMMKPGTYSSGKPSQEDEKHAHLDWLLDQSEGVYNNVDLLALLHHMTVEQVKKVIHSPHELDVNLATHLASREAYVTRRLDVDDVLAIIQKGCLQRRRWENAENFAALIRSMVEMKVTAEQLREALLTTTFFREEDGSTVWNITEEGMRHFAFNLVSRNVKKQNWYTTYLTYDNTIFRRYRKVVEEFQLDATLSLNTLSELRELRPEHTFTARVNQREWYSHAKGPSNTVQDGSSILPREEVFNYFMSTGEMQTYLESIDMLDVAYDWIVGLLVPADVLAADKELIEHRQNCRIVTEASLSRRHRVYPGMILAA